MKKLEKKDLEAIRGGKLVVLSVENGVITSFDTETQTYEYDFY